VSLNPLVNSVVTRFNVKELDISPRYFQLVLITNKDSCSERPLPNELHKMHVMCSCKINKFEVSQTSFVLKLFEAQ
jgi:hypothetical protein